MLSTTQNYAKTLFIALMGFALLWHFWSLSYSPLPWEDETFFASITHSFINGKGFHLAVRSLQTNGEPVLTYGPVYFFLTGLITKTLGFGLYSFRLANMLAAIISVFLFYKISRKLAWKQRTIYIFTILLAFDVIFIQNAHSGRMDIVALAFLLSSINLYLSNNTTITKQAIIATLSTLAVLTTLRIAVLVLPFLALLFFNNINNKQYKEAATLFFTSIALYVIWIIIAFGSFSSFIARYTQNSFGNDPDSTLASAFLGGNLVIQPYQYPMVIIGLAAIIYLIKTQYKNLLFWHLILPILCFYLLVKDTGAYSALVVPFWYMLIGFAFEELSININKRFTRFISLSLVMLLLIVNGGVFILKSTTILTTIPQRSNKQLTTWVQKQLPAQSRVIGDKQFYYAVIESNSDFKYILQYPSNEHIVIPYTKSYLPDYLFVSEQTPPEIIEIYKKYFIFKETYNYSPKTQPNFFTKLIQKLPMQIHTSLGGKLIKITQKTSSD